MSTFWIVDFMIFCTDPLFVTFFRRLPLGNFYFFGPLSLLLGDYIMTGFVQSDGSGINQQNHLVLIVTTVNTKPNQPSSHPIPLEIRVLLMLERFDCQTLVLTITRTITRILT